MSLSSEDIANIVKAVIEATDKKSEVKVVDVEEDYKAVAVLDEPSDEEILYWSTPFYDELVARKEDKKKRIEEESVLRGEDNG